MSSIVLKFEEHQNRLGHIAKLAHFLHGAVSRTAKTLTAEKGFLSAQDQLVAGIKLLSESFSPPLQLDSEKIRACLTRWAVPTDASRSLVYSLCLVMLITQVEIFIEHLTDVILSVEPRRLKDLASDKQLNCRELVDARDYETVMARLREKVADEVIRSSPREMMEKHLGTRFRLFEKGSLTCTTVEDSGETRAWGIDDIERTWKTRHEVVHEGRIDLSEIEFERALFVCSWLEIFLSVRAQAVYGVAVDSDTKLRLLNSLFDTGQRYVSFNIRLCLALSGILDELRNRE